MPVSHTLLMYLDVILVFLQVNTLRGVQKVKFLLTRESDHCSCPLISRQGVYLKLTLPADVDILAESDNPTHCADGFHCNVRSPLQDYAMPFLHSVSAWTRCSLPSSFSRTVCHSITLRTADYPWGVQLNGLISFSIWKKKDFCTVWYHRYFLIFCAGRSGTKLRHIRPHNGLQGFTCFDVAGRVSAVLMG